MITPNLNLEQMKYHISLLTGDENTPVTLQFFYDPKGEAQRPDLAKHIISSIDDATTTIQHLQSQLCGVYVGVNVTNGVSRKIEDVTQYRAVFADFDGCTEPVWPITPHFTTSRDATHGHAYWLVDGINDVDTFRRLQRTIALSCGTDQQVVDPCRVLRLAGSIHYKNKTEPKQYSVATDYVQVVGKQHRYSVADIENNFTLGEPEKELLDTWLNSRTALSTGSGFSDTDVNKKRFIHFISDAAEPAIQGSGSATLIKVSSMGRDLGLTLEVATELLWTHYDPRCIPSWSSTNEYRDFCDTVERAYRYARNEIGCRTAFASFKNAPPIEPLPAPKTYEELKRTGDRLSEQQGKIMSAMMTVKSPHYELAQVYDGVVHNGNELIRCEKIWYEFNGKSWAERSDDVIKSNIQRFYSKLKPADALTSGITKVLCDLTNVERVTNGVWLNTNTVADGIVCFKNGLVDLGDDVPVVQPHTPNFFTFNELQYDYDPTAKCPNWIKFLEQIWDYDLELITQLQEFMGYCLIPSVDLEKFATFVGKSRAGKGTISKVLRMLVGESNTAAPSLSSLIKDSSLHKLSTASVAFIPDAHSVNAARRDEVLSMFKAITGGDPVDYHVMYKGTHTSKFRLKFILSTNGMPEFNDPSGALANRMLVFPFLNTYAGKEDIYLGSKLLAECSGIAQWALEGLRRLKRNGKFTEAESGLREKENIREDMSPLSRFIEDVCVIDDDGFTSNDELYDVYMTWCSQNHVMHPLSSNKVSRELHSSPLTIVQGRTRIDNKQVRGFKGLKLSRFDAIE